MSQPSSSNGTYEHVITTHGLTRVFGSGENAVTAIDRVDLEIRQGEFLAVTGRSGSGKTTLLNLISGLDRPTSGQVFFQGMDLALMREADLVGLRRSKIGFVFQSFGLMPLLSAVENVELPLHIKGMAWRQRRHQAMEILELVGLDKRAKHRPYELSGGEQQRVSIARALVTMPDVVFADEPTGELDTTTAAAIGATLRDVASERNTTVVVVTHDLELAAMTSRQVELTDGSIATPGESSLSGAT